MVIPLLIYFIVALALVALFAIAIISKNEASRTVLDSTTAVAYRWFTSPWGLLIGLLVVLLMLWWLFGDSIREAVSPTGDSTPQVEVTPRVEAVPTEPGPASDFWTGLWSYRTFDALAPAIAMGSIPFFLVFGIMYLVGAPHTWVRKLGIGGLVATVFLLAYASQLRTDAENAVRREAGLTGPAAAANALTLRGGGASQLPPGGVTAPIRVSVGEYLQVFPVLDPVSPQYEMLCVDRQGNQVPEGVPPCVEGGDFVAFVFKNATGEFLDFSYVRRRK